MPENNFDPGGITLREYLDFRFTQIDAKLAKVEADVDSLETTRSELAGKADAGVVNRVLLISMASLILAAIGLGLRFLGV
jgi:hypothetical protein